MDSVENASQSYSNGVHFSKSRRSSTKNEELPILPMESSNWLMHLSYCRGQLQQTRQLIQQQLERSRGRNEYAHYLKGVISSDEGKQSEALQEFQMCNRLSPNNITYIKHIAKCLFQQKRYKMSLEALMEAEKLSKTLDWEIHYWIAECLVFLGSPDTALQWSQRAASSGRAPHACQQLARLLAARGTPQAYAEAAQAAEMALQSAPDDVDLLTFLGLLHARAGQQQLAVERLGSALALAPPQAKALLPMAAIMQSHRDYDVALSRYKIAAQQTPDCAALWNNIGMCFFGKQKLIAAVSCLKRASSLSPVSGRILHNLGLLHLTAGQTTSAFSFLCAAINLRPAQQAPITTMLMAITLSRLLDYGNALKAFEEAMSLSPEDPLIRINYSSFLLSRGLTEQARHHLSVAEDIAGRTAYNDREFIDQLVYLRGLLLPASHLTPSHLPPSRDARSPRPDRPDALHVPQGEEQEEQHAQLEEDEV